ncbi:MAG TPA: DUF2267 domain-containing protein [Geminicoccaceae bacterium]|nr:DUF2267 domain-containing protein [Geminicoccaceae bacterium]
MTTTGLEVFDTTVQRTNIWLNEIAAQIGPDRQRAYHVLRAVLHALRDRLTPDEAAHLSAQLPMLVRGLFFEGWHPAHKPDKDRSEEDFLHRVRAGMTGIQPINAEAAATAVFRVVARHVTAGESAHVRDMLPKEVRRLWP